MDNIMERVTIGANFLQQPTWKKAVGIPLIYFPLITTTPFVLLGVLLVRIHLKYVGAMNIRSYWDFVPAWISHRYRNDNQIIYTTGSTWYNLRAHRFYWIFNCKLYCPLSVALFAYAAYLVLHVDGTSIQRVLTLYIIFVLPNLSLYGNTLRGLLRIKRKAEISPHMSIVKNA